MRIVRYSAWLEATPKAAPRGVADFQLARDESCHEPMATIVSASDGSNMKSQIGRMWPEVAFGETMAKPCLGRCSVAYLACSLSISRSRADDQGIILRFS